MDAVTAVIADLIKQRGRGTNRELADALGVTEPTVSRWSHGKAQASPEYWEGIERFFGLEVGALGLAGVDVTRKLVQLEAEIQELRELAAEVPRLRDLAERLLRQLEDGTIEP